MKERISKQKNYGRDRRSSRPILFMLCVFMPCVLSSGFGCIVPQETTGADADALWRQFPDHAARVVEGRDAFVARVQGFAPDAEDDIQESTLGRGQLSIALPASADGDVRFSLPGGFEARVRELDATGHGTIVGHSVAYTRAGATSYWSVTEQGYEEWLLLDADQVKSDAPIAAWEVEGATLRQEGEAVAVTDEQGVQWLQVTAPAAYGAGGRPVAARLTVRGTLLELSVDADGETLLIDPLWSLAPSMSHARAGHTATVLINADVLVAGGFQFVSSAERYQVFSNTWTSAGSMNIARRDHTATRLNDYTVLVVGGHNSSGGVLASVELYDPTANTWSTTASMSTARYAHTSTLLGNGKVLVAGGISNDYVLLSAELFDPVTHTWSATPQMLHNHYNATATLLGNGKVLVAGGGGCCGAGDVLLAELYDPTTNTWASAASMSGYRESATATLLGNGKVLVAGGRISGFNVTESAVLYDPTSNTWSTVAPMTTPRIYHTATKLTSLTGKVLVTGGQSSILGTPTYYASAELYNPTNNTWTPTSSMSARRMGHTATLLGGRSIRAGNVLVTGGDNPLHLSSVELYTP